jgi:NAD-dependent SIR2 family protein deacetylase
LSTADEPQAMNSATKHSQKGDLGIVLGSSLKVTPACDLPAKILGNGGRVVIVNLQSTPLDPRASLVRTVAFLVIF